MKNQKNKKLIILVTTFVLLIIVMLSTYAYFIARAQSDKESSIQAETKTTDLLTFESGEILEINANQGNFQKDMPNLTDISNVSAELQANNNTFEAEAYYDLILKINNNEFKYTKGTNPELVLVIKRPDGSYLEKVSGYRTVNVKVPNETSTDLLKGIDITEETKDINLSLNNLITATQTEDGYKKENWELTLVLVNLETNQKDNEGKNFTAEVVIKKSENIETPKLEIDNVTTIISNINDLPSEAEGRLFGNVYRVAYLNENGEYEVEEDFKGLIDLSDVNIFTFDEKYDYIQSKVYSLVSYLRNKPDIMPTVSAGTYENNFTNLEVGLYLVTPIDKGYYPYSIDSELNSENPYYQAGDIACPDGTPVFNSASFVKAKSILVNSVFFDKDTNEFLFENEINVFEDDPDIIIDELEDKTINVEVSWIDVGYEEERPTNINLEVYTDSYENSDIPYVLYQEKQIASEENWSTSINLEKLKYEITGCTIEPDYISNYLYQLSPENLENYYTTITQKDNNYLIEYIHK